MSPPTPSWQLNPLPESHRLPPDLPPAIARTLQGRGINHGAALRFFLEPPHRLPYSPLRLSGMETALQRLHRAVMTRETVGIVGDFDVDGVTGAAIMQEGLAHFGLPTLPYLPHRVAEGHGLSANAVAQLADAGAALIITVDCGVSSAAEVALARRRGIDVIITDHHLPGADRPPAVAIINPRMPGNEYPYPHLCGAGLAYKLMQGLYERHGRTAPASLLELAAIGTIADLVPLQDENRYLVKEGLKQLARTQRPGLLALYRRAAIRPDALNAETVSFRIAPRLNSPGRMGHAGDSLKLLTTTCPDEAEALAETLETLNHERQVLTRQAYAAALSRLEQREYLPPLILVRDPLFTPGIAGLVAGRLTEDFHRPAVALAPLDGQRLMASGRSIPTFNLARAFASCADLFIRYGGHAQAGGFTIAAANLPALEQRLSAIAGELLDEANLHPTLAIDAEIGLADLNPSFFRYLARMEPFGPANPQPRFLTRGLPVAAVQRVGKEGQHLKLQVGQGNRQYPALAFNRAGQWLESRDTVDLVYSVQVERWRGRERTSLVVADFQ